MKEGMTTNTYEIIATFKVPSHGDYTINVNKINMIL